MKLHRIHPKLGTCRRCMRLTVLLFVVACACLAGTYLWVPILSLPAAVAVGALGTLGALHAGAYVSRRRHGERVRLGNCCR